MIHHALLAAVLSTGAAAPTAQDGITIRTDFPGGNVLVNKIEGDTLQLAPDLRGGRPWFYWYFEVSANRDRKLFFVFPEVKNMSYVGMQGPAISTDAGKTWAWLGAAAAAKGSFSHQLVKDKPVRFAVTIPYLQANLDAFLKQCEANPHLSKTLLTKSGKGRPVELLQIGQPGPGRRAVLATCRHHACESMASFLLQGFLQAAMSDSEAGKQFRDRYVLYAVPMVDKDGVEDGDQGKNRNPHDHNRDYHELSRYPEVQAIMKLSGSKSIDLAVDFHCPTLWMDYHQVIYFVGPKDVPKNNERNVKQFAELIKKEMPKEGPGGPLVLLQSERTPNHYSDFFSRQPRTILATTLEFPFAPPGKTMDGAACVRYGEAVLRAWVQAQFAAD